MSRQPRSSTEGQFDLGTFVVLSPDGDSQAGCGEAILNFDLKKVVEEIVFRRQTAAALLCK